MDWFNNRRLTNAPAISRRSNSRLPITLNARTSRRLSSHIRKSPDGTDDGAGLATKAHSSQPTAVGEPRLMKSHTGFETKAARLYFDVQVPALRRRLGTEADWRQYHQYQVHRCRV